MSFEVSIFAHFWDQSRFSGLMVPNRPVSAEVRRILQRRPKNQQDYIRLFCQEFPVAPHIQSQLESMVIFPEAKETEVQQILEKVFLGEGEGFRKLSQFSSKKYRDSANTFWELVKKKLATVNIDEGYDRVQNAGVVLPSEVRKRAAFSAFHWIFPVSKTIEGCQYLAYYIPDDTNYDYEEALDPKDNNSPNIDNFLLILNKSVTDELMTELVKNEQFHPLLQSLIVTNASVFQETLYEDLQHLFKEGKEEKHRLFLFEGIRWQEHFWNLLETSLQQEKEIVLYWKILRQDYSPKPAPKQLIRFTFEHSQNEQGNMVISVYDMLNHQQYPPVELMKILTIWHFREGEKAFSHDYDDVEFPREMQLVNNFFLMMKLDHVLNGRVRSIARAQTARKKSTTLAQFLELINQLNSESHGEEFSEVILQPPGSLIRYVATNFADRKKV